MKAKLLLGYEPLLYCKIASPHANTNSTTPELGDYYVGSRRRVLNWCLIFSKSHQNYFLNKGTNIIIYLVNHNLENIPQVFVTLQRILRMYLKNASRERAGSQGTCIAFWVPSCCVLRRLLRPSNLSFSSPLLLFLSSTCQEGIGRFRWRGWTLSFSWKAI